MDSFFNNQSFVIGQGRTMKNTEPFVPFLMGRGKGDFQQRKQQIDLSCGASVRREKRERGGKKNNRRSFDAENGEKRKSI